MESIEHMVKRLCPDGIKQVRLGEVCKVLRGKRLTKKELFDDAQYKVFHGGLSPIGYYTEANRPAQTVMVINVGASAGTVGFCDEEFWSSDGCFCLSHHDEVAHPKYLYYYLAGHQLSIQSKVRKAGIPTLDASAVKEIEIPLPPMEIQNRIVEILDKMTTLTAELEAELEARKQQYEYYRNKLLTFNKLSGGGIRQVTWKKISEIGTVMRGVSFQKKHFTAEGTPCIHYGQIYTQYAHHAYKTFSYVGDEISRSPRRAKTGALVMATTSENIEDVGKCIVWLGEEDVIVSNDACFIQHTLNPKYLGYLMQTELFSKYKKKVATGTKVIRINADAVADFVIPVPTMDEQERIVSILDRFEALTTDLQIGLPAEIEARRQQYEYYRNKLLTFNQTA